MRLKLLFILSLFHYLSCSQVWVRLADFPGTQRDDGVAVRVGNTAYFGTGLIEWAATIDFYALNLSNNTWSSIPTMPHTTERQYACAFEGQNCFYVFGGDGLGGARNDLYKYDVFAETWTAMSAKPGGGLIGAVCMPFGDKIIISGGKFQSGKPSAEVWEYSLSSDSWQQKNNYPFAGRWRASATVLNGLGYLLFGSDSSGSYRKELYRYEPVNDNWTQLGDFPTGTGRMYAALGVANSKLFLFGGYDSLGVFYKDLWYYTEATDNWLQGPNLPSTGRRGGMSCTTGDKFYYSCGLGEGPMRLRETWMTDIPLGISGENRSTEIKIYPNPANDKIHIWLSENNNKTLSYRHCTIYGHYSELKELNDFEIDLSSWKAGIYFIEFYSGKRKLGTGRVIKR